MATGSKPDTAADARAWAAESLGIAKDGSFDDAKRAYFKAVREHEFLPPPELRRALDVMAGGSPSAPRDEEQRCQQENELRRKIADFADQFFSIPTDERQDRWRDLLKRCRTANAPALVAWVRSLEAGLDVDVPEPAADKSVGARLVEHLIQSFPRPPFEQVASRQKLLREVEHFTPPRHQKTWQQAARHLKSKLPAIAALDELLIDRLAEVSGSVKRRQKLRDRNLKKAKTSNQAAKLAWLVPVWIVVGAVISHESSKTRPYEPYSNRSYTNQPLAAPRDAFALGANLPPISELVDPAKFDVEYQPSFGEAIRFIPRPGTEFIGADTPNKGRPLLLGKAIFVLCGGTFEQFDALKARAARKQQGEDNGSELPETPEH